MLSMSLLGLHFYPAVLFALIIMLRQLRQDRYDFAIMSLIFIGGYGLISRDILLVKNYDLGLAAGLAFAVILRKPPIMCKALSVFIALILVTVFIALQSWESIKVQALIMRGYYGFITVFLFIGIFANQSFDLSRMIRRMMVYLMIFCVFVIIEALILRGSFFLPGNVVWGEPSTFYHLNLFTTSGPYRDYPPPLYIGSIVWIPAMRMFHLNWKYWAIFCFALLLTQTATLMAAFATIIILFQGSWRRTVGICVSLTALLGVIYLVDSILPGIKGEYHDESALRIKSTIEQFIELREATDDEDISEFGSGRMAQIIPKAELIDRYKRHWIGLGFLHPEKTTMNALTIINEYYSDVSSNEEAAATVEVVAVQFYISGGWILFITMNLFLLGLWLIVARLKYSYIFGATIVFCIMAGIGGFSSLAQVDGHFLLAFSFALVILANRSGLPGFTNYK